MVDPTVMSMRSFLDGLIKRADNGTVLVLARLNNAKRIINFWSVSYFNEVKVLNS